MGRGVTSRAFGCRPHVEGYWMQTESMVQLREMLGQLGWPVEELLDEELLEGIRTRWFATRPRIADARLQLSPASAMGIVSAFAREGNLDSLCWTEGEGSDVSEVDLAEELTVFERDSEGAAPVQDDRRASPRERAHDVVSWTCALDDPHTGWLVCRAAGGIAFIVETRESPAPGERITARVHSRFGGMLELGGATVVRTEPLNETLTLVCVQLEEALWSSESRG